MRIVEYQPDITSTQFRAIKAIGVGAALLSLIVFSLMVTNFVSLKRSDPIHSPALLQLIEQLKANPQDETLKEQIRDLDLLARRAFFASQRFVQVGTFLLLGGIIVALVSFRTMASQERRLPYPNSHPAPESLAGNAAWARKAITAAGLILIGLALSLAIPWKSPLDQIHASGEDDVGSLSAPSASQGGLLTSSPTAKVAAPSRDEILKNWPHFLGASGGHATAAELPVAWDVTSGENILWKTQVPRSGFSSPVIWNDRIFLTGAEKEAREVYCFNVADGSVLWRHAATGIPGSPAEPPDVLEDTGLAAPTTATDGSRVFAMFATGDIVALDFAGKRLWARNLGVPSNPYGHGSSLLAHNGLLFVQMDQSEGSFLLALDAKTGEPRWRIPREFGASWSTPILIENGGRTELILSATSLVAYDPASGRELWRVLCLDHGESAPTPVYANGLIYVAAESIGLVAVDASAHSIAWRTDEHIPSVSTPIVAGELLIYGLAEGGIVCRDAKTGEQIWMHETDDGFYSSPIVSGGRVYLNTRKGTVYIFSATKEFKLIASPALGEEAVATPAILGDSLFYRGVKHLFRIGS